MSYGVNTWAPTSGRARSAGKTKKRARPTARKSASRSAPRARKPSKKKSRTITRPKKKRAPARGRAATKRAPKKRAAPKKKAAKKAKLYTRYDPETGQKVRVTADTFEYSEWPSRKPSKKKIQREALKNDPIGTVGQIGVTAGRKAVERAGEQMGRQVLREAQRAIPGVAVATGAARAAVTAAAVPAAVAGVGLALALSLGSALRAQARLKVGNAVEKLSRQFVANQQALIRATGARSWNDVPQQARAQLLRDYKSAVATAAAQGGLTRSVEGYK